MRVFVADADITAPFSLAKTALASVVEQPERDQLLRDTAGAVQASIEIVRQNDVRRSEQRRWREENNRITLSRRWIAALAGRTGPLFRILVRCLAVELRGSCNFVRIDMHILKSPNMRRDHKSKSRTVSSDDGR